MRSKLSPLQSAILDAFFERNRDFFLTGGAALAGFHLGHRTTHDLDLFTTSDRLEEGSAALREAAIQLGAHVEPIQTSPMLRRFLVRRGDDGVMVDLIHDPTAQGDSEKLALGSIRVDPPQEILANKLCALLSRSELRDIVDVLELERSGRDLRAAASLAMNKDSGFTPAQLAWVLSQIAIGDDARIPGGRSVGELREYLADLQARLTRMARADA